jgi:hypothetical protein
MTDSRGLYNDPELKQALDTTVARVCDTRRTFTDHEALAETVWSQGYDVGLQVDPRFALAQELHAEGPRQWRLAAHTVANNHLLEALQQGQWDGRNLDSMLIALDQANGGHHVFCATDPRFQAAPDGRLGAGQQLPARLDQETKTALDAHATALLGRWKESGSEPMTVREITDLLSSLECQATLKRGATAFVRAWLLEWPEAQRVGIDYWVPASAVPTAPRRRKMQVLPVLPLSISTSHEQLPPETQQAIHVLDLAESLVPQSNTMVASSASWIQTLRTVHLVHGFLPIPSNAWAAIPPRAHGVGTWEVVPGKWFESDETIWLWLDRDSRRLCGTQLEALLAWRDTGERLRVTWTAEVVVLKLEGIDPDVHQEESRLVDPTALAALRGGIGESYRQSIAIVLAEHPEGLAFREVVSAVRLRQQHTVHPGSLRAVLHAGGFESRNGLWYAGEDPRAGARRLRRAMATATLESNDSPQDEAAVSPRCVVNAVRARLRELREALAQ